MPCAAARRRWPEGPRADAKAEGQVASIGGWLPALGAEGSITGTGRAARRVSDQLSRALINLARSGNPQHDGLPAWSQYKLPERATMVFDAETLLIGDPRRAERALFAKVPFLQWGS